MIGLTTGRQTSQRLNSLLKELAYTLPRARIIRRGKSSIEDLAQRLLTEGFEYAMILQRWHGGPGRIDFYNVTFNGLIPIPPSILLREVKLGREHPSRGRHSAEAITYGNQASKATRTLATHLSKVFDLPELSVSTNAGGKTTLHLDESSSDRSITLAIMTITGQDVGPRMAISGLIWDLNESRR